MPSAQRRIAMRPCSIFPTSDADALARNDEERMALQSLKPKIVAGQSLSDSVDCTNGTVLSVMVPPNWPPRANISMQISPDGANYYDATGRDGREFVLTAIAGTAISLGGEETPWKGMHLKLRSGSRSAPVKQTEDVEFTVAIQ